MSESKELNQKQKTVAELQAADPSTLTHDEITRRINLANLAKAERELVLVEEQNQKHADAKEEYRLRMIQRKEDIQHNADILARERGACKHKTGGKNLPGFFNGDGKWGYCVAPLSLPTNERYFLCMRCQEEWHLPKKRDVLNGNITLAQYRAQEAKYNEVSLWSKELFQTEDGSFPTSVVWNIPRLQIQQAKDDAEFATYLASVGQSPVSAATELVPSSRVI